MNRHIANAIGLLSIGALSLSCWFIYEAGMTVKENRANAAAIAASSKTGIEDVFAESRDVTIALLKPCKAGKPETCGLIPAIRQVALDTGNATQAMRDQINQTQPLIQNAATAVKETAEHLNSTVDAATSTTLQARADLVTLNDSIGATKPLLTAFTRSGDDLNTILEGDSLKAILANSASVTGSAAGIMADGQKISDKYTSDYLSPKPWYTKAWHYAGDTYDLAALIARHSP